MKIIGPGTAVTREFSQKYPNSIKAYLMSYLDGLKKTLEDEDFARKTETKYTKISDAKILAENYQQGLRVWNKDMSVDPAAIRIVLDESSDPKAKTADPKRFYDNFLIEAVNREYASETLPGRCAVERPDGTTPLYLSLTPLLNPPILGQVFRR